MLILIVYGPGSIRTFGEHRGQLTGTSQKLADLVHSGEFSMVLLTDFGSRVDPDVRGTPGLVFVDLAKTRRFGPFWPVFYGITHGFRVPGRSERSGITRVSLRGPRQNS